MLRKDQAYVDQSGKLTQAGWQALQGALDVLTKAQAAQGADIADLLANEPVAPGTAPRYACRAWVNFDGTGTVAIRASGNVASITDNGPGDYTINFTDPMPDADYAVAVSSGSNATAPIAFVADNAMDRTASAVRIRTTSTAFGLTDSAHVSVMIFR